MAAGDLICSVTRRWPRHRLVRTMAFHLGEQIASRSRVLTGRMPGGSPICLLSTDRQHRQIYFHGEYEPDVTALIRARVRPGDVLYDVGANAGYFTFLALDLGATVHAFEPNPRVRALIESSLALRARPTAELSPYACSNESGQAMLYLADATNTGMTSLERASRDSIIVEATTLSAYWQASGVTPGLIKIDVEGHELAVIRGAHELLERARPDLIVEVTDGEVLTVLEEIGYRAHGIDHDGAWVPVDASSLSLAGGYANMFFSASAVSGLASEWPRSHRGRSGRDHSGIVPPP